MVYLDLLQMSEILHKRKIQVFTPFGDFDVVVVVEAEKLVPDHDFVGAFWFFTVGSKFCEEKCNKGWEI